VTAPAAQVSRAARGTSPAVGPPLWLLLELTYRCPLHCVFCYNPTEFARTGAELPTAEWIRVLREARALGAVQLGLSGGEPLEREDLEIIVAEAHALGYYINLITSGVGLTEARCAALKTAGLDHIQLSFQDSTRELNDFLSSTRTFELKAKVAALIRAHDYPMVLNVVLHRLNIDHVGEILEMAERAERGPPRHLVRLGSFQSLSRRSLDEGALPELSGTGAGLRRLPLPGVPDDRGCHQHRPGL